MVGMELGNDWMGNFWVDEDGVGCSGEVMDWN